MPEPKKGATPERDEQERRPSRLDASARASRARIRDPKDELRRFEAVSDPVVLAATDRAKCHRRHEVDGVILSQIVDHLGFVHGAWTTRNLRPQVNALLAAGALSKLRRHGRDYFALTSSGRRRLTRARRADEIALPESPQHRTWRHAREQAVERVDEFRELFRRTLDEAVALLDTEQIDSDPWFALSARLRQTSW